MKQPIVGIDRKDVFKLIKQNEFSKHYKTFTVKEHYLHVVSTMGKSDIILCHQRLVRIVVQVIQKLAFLATQIPVTFKTINAFQCCHIEKSSQNLLSLNVPLPNV